MLEENEQDSEVGELMDRDSEDLGITQCNRTFWRVLRKEEM